MAEELFEQLEAEALGLSEPLAADQGTASFRVACNYEVCLYIQLSLVRCGYRGFHHTCIRHAMMMYICT